MSLKCVITGGHLKLDKNIYIKEMLSKDGAIKKMLSSNEDNVTLEKPRVTKDPHNPTVDINFNGSSSAEIGEEYHKILQELKIKYKDKITGRVVISIFTYSTIYITIDLEKLEN